MSVALHMSVLDGGRSIWEPVWQAAVERVRIQKSNAAAPETPLHSQSGAVSMF